MKKFKKKDYKKISEAIFKKTSKVCSSSYLRGIDEGRYFSEDIKKEIDTLDRSEFETIDYGKLSIAISKKLKRPYTATYVKKVLEGSYKSASVKEVADKLTGVK